MITLQTAGAGSGKTHATSGRIAEKIGEGTCRPEGLIATTFTKSAAAELRTRVRERLYEEGHAEAASRLDLATIGTVHSCCQSIIQRFAIHAGISPEVRVIEEVESNRILARAIDMAVDPDHREELDRLARRLGQFPRDGRKQQVPIWSEELHTLIERTRSNNINPADIPRMERDNWELLRSHLGDPVEGLDEQLERELERTLSEHQQAYQSILDDGGKPSNPVKKNIAGLEEALRRHRSKNGLTWGEWLTLAPKPAGSLKFKQLVDLESLATLGRRAVSHPRLHADLERYLELLFQSLVSVLETFSRIKAESGVFDFSDLERETLLLLLENPTVQETLDAELQLLVVDEFQDTNPIQLAIFARLASWADETFWVGDLKQAIYGFRQSDPELIRAVGASDLIQHADPLPYSWRSDAPLVDFANALFVPPFVESLGCSPGEIALGFPEKRRELPTQPDPDTPHVEFLTLDSRLPGKNQPSAPRRAEALADAILSCLDRDPCPQVFDKTLREWRDAVPGDVAILVRTNKTAEGVAEALLQRGQAVTYEKPGLFATPEAVLALACLRRIGYRGAGQDEIAAAEILSLAGSLEPEEWLAGRLDWRARVAAAKQAGSENPPAWGTEGNSTASSLLGSLDAAARQADALSPAGILDLALSLGDVPGRAARWGPDPARSAARLANLERLRGLAGEYEDTCLAGRRPATLVGMLGWFDFLAQKKLDKLPAQQNSGAIHILTYHASKGLEWPVVFAYELEFSARPRFWSAAVVPGGPDATPLDISDPLAGRALRLRVNPFGTGATDDPVTISLQNSEEGREALRLATEEEQRLLYVGLTRARNRLVLVRELDGETSMLACCDSAGLTDPGWGADGAGQGSEGAAALLANVPGVDPVLVRQWRVAYSEHAPAAVSADDTLAVFPAHRPDISLTGRTSATIRPSASESESSSTAVEGACIGEIIKLGSKIPINGSTSDYRSRDLGDAVHAIFAAGILRPGLVTADQAAAILKRFDLTDVVSPAAVLAALETYLASLSEHFGVSPSGSPEDSRIEIPFTYRTSRGQQCSGFIDHLLTTPSGPVILDHKTFPAENDTARAEKALSYASQLAAYRDALASDPGRAPSPRDLSSAASSPPPRTFIHFPVTGYLVEILLPAPCRPAKG